MGLSQVTTMDVEVSWDSAKLSRMLSINEARINTIMGGGRTDNTNIAVTIDQQSQQKLSFIYMTPQINRPKPESLIYDDLYSEC